MGRVLLEDKILWFYDSDNNKSMIMDYNDKIGNNSRIPLQESGEGMITMPELLVKLYNDSRTLFQPSYSDSEIVDCLLIDGKIMSVLYRHPGPFRAVQFGTSDRMFSYNIAELLGTFNSQSSICLISEYEPYYSDKPIGYLANPPKISYHFSSFENTELNSGYFDMVFITGNEIEEDPLKVMQEAARLVNEKGCVFCYVSNDSFTEKAFRLIFEKHEKYEITTDRALLFFSKKTGCVWNEMQIDTLENRCSELISEIKNVLSSENSRSGIKKYIFKADRLADRALKENDCDIKIKLLKIKEAVLDYVLNTDPVYEDHYLEKIRSVL